VLYIYADVEGAGGKNKMNFARGGISIYMMMMAVELRRFDCGLESYFTFIYLYTGVVIRGDPCRF